MAMAAVGLAAAVIAGVGAARDSPPDVAVPEIDTEVSPLGSPQTSRADSPEAPAAPATAAVPGTAGTADTTDEHGGSAEPGAAAGPDAPSHDDGSQQGIVVAVQGLVGHSGLVRLAQGARVADALEAAGGPLDGADLLSLNLAQKLHDGDQVLVGVAPADGAEPRLGSATIAAGGGPADAAGTAGAGGGPVDLNTATQSALETLPGVGPVTAQSILDWRSQNGRFTSVDQLVEVKGIGPATLADLRDAVTV